jgi:putative MFS transporter
MAKALSFLTDLKSVLTLTVIVAGLGYFVDLFDITLYGVVRTPSLIAMGITDKTEILNLGIFIYNAQMIGMMVGGLGWGLLADKRGRLSVMFGSILLYSIANIANSFVHDVNTYALCRFLCGLGLAGELGAAVTLVAESLPKEKRGLGTTIVATLGMLGIVAAAKLGSLMSWHNAYLVGGILGIFLLFARFKITESKIFDQAQNLKNRGNLKLILKPRALRTYLSCIAIGIPIYFTTGVLFTFAPELTAGLGIKGTVTAGNAIFYGSVGLTVGDLLSGLISQAMQSRKRAVALGLIAGLGLMFANSLLPGLTAEAFYLICFLIGTSVGYWAVLVTMAAEQFGTNIRGTVATTVPNFVRGSAVLAVWGFAYLKNQMSVASAAMTVGSICFGLALICLMGIEETFGKDLNFQEGDRA